MKQFDVNDVVEFHPKHCNKMVGTIVRIVKASALFVPTDDPTLWTYHVSVSSIHPRNSGTFVVSAKNLKKVLK